MFDEPVVYVDIETTGGSYRTSRIIEFAAIRVENGDVVETYQTLINPGSPIPFHITRLTGISDNDVVDSPFFNEVADKIHHILDGAIFIAHNVRFDYSFLKRQLEGCSIRYNPRMLCSVRISRALYPQATSHKLESIIRRHRIPTKARHRAYDDAHAVKQFLEIAYQEHGEDSFLSAIKKQLRHRSAPPNVDSRAFDNIPDTAGVYTFLDQNDIPIYIGKSVTLRKRIMSHFAQDTAIDKEMKLSLSTHKISFIETANELEALLLESKMVKENLPLYNYKLRRFKKMYVLNSQVTPEGYQAIDLNYVDTEQITPSSSIYGIYPSKMKAVRSLEIIQKTFDLCPKLLGLEKSKSGCFKSQLGKCRGACKQNEAPASYNLRFEIAFERNKIDSWPYNQPVLLTHLDSHAQSKHLVLDNWNVIGELDADEGCEPRYKAWQSVFDIDTYKIIRSYISNKSSRLNIKPISYQELEQYC